MLWQAPEDKRVKYDDSHHLRAQTLRVKRRGDLLRLATRHPGLLAGQFLAQVRVKLNQEVPGDSTQLRETDASHWALVMSNLKDVRDQKELLFLPKLLKDIGGSRLPAAADLICMRIRELRQAKAEGGSWEKASVLSLMPGNHPASAPLADGAFTL